MLMIAIALGSVGVLLAVARVWGRWPWWLISTLALVAVGTVIIGNDWYRSRRAWREDIAPLRAMMENKTVIEVKKVPDGHTIYVVESTDGATEWLHEYPFKYQMRRGKELFLAMEMAMAFAAIVAVVAVSALALSCGKAVWRRTQPTA